MYLQILTKLVPSFPMPVVPLQILDLALWRPRYQPVRLLGDRILAKLATAYLTYQSGRLRPGSYKAVRFATELLVSHLGTTKVGNITQVQGREVLSLITQLSPNVRKYREGQRAGLSELVKLSKQVEPYRILAPQTQGRIWKHMLQFLDWCVEQGELSNNLCAPHHQREARGLSSQGPHG